MATSASTNTLRLYKDLMREAGKFVDFNFRSYFQRRIRDSFKEAKTLRGEEAREHLNKAQDNLQMLRRQVTVGQLFNSGQKLSIEQNNPHPRH